MVHTSLRYVTPEVVKQIKRSLKYCTLIPLSDMLNIIWHDSSFCICVCASLVLHHMVAMYPVHDLIG